MENQKTEWKRQWRNEFLKGLCGLANAQGDTLEIGLDNAKELLAELPNMALCLTDNTNY